MNETVISCDQEMVCAGILHGLCSTAPDDFLDNIIGEFKKLNQIKFNHYKTNGIPVKVDYTDYTSLYERERDLVLLNDSPISKRKSFERVITFIQGYFCYDLNDEDKEFVGKLLFKYTRIMMFCIGLYGFGLSKDRML